MPLPPHPPTPPALLACEQVLLLEGAASWLLRAWFSSRRLSMVWTMGKTGCGQGFPQGGRLMHGNARLVAGTVNLSTSQDELPSDRLETNKAEAKHCLPETNQAAGAAPTSPESAPLAA